MEQLRQTDHDSSIVIDVPMWAFDDFASGTQNIETNYRRVGLKA